MAKRIAVVGATGTQGSSVVQAVLKSGSPGEWSIRALARNPEGEPAQALKTSGVEVVAADLNDVQSLRTAFSDCYAVFAVTDFFVPFAALGCDIEKTIELEEKYASNILEAVKSNPSIAHFIWSTLPEAEKISGGELRIPHFVAKNRMDERIKADPELLAKTTFLWVGWYATNIRYPIFKPSFLVRLTAQFVISLH
jgi:NAD(P)-dependent dehydrogenase (short-subunit alcohol dehydrogenase family)